MYLPLAVAPRSRVVLSEPVRLHQREREKHWQRRQGRHGQGSQFRQGQGQGPQGQEVRPARQCCCLDAQPSPGLDAQPIFVCQSRKTPRRHQYLSHGDWICCGETHLMPKKTISDPSCRHHHHRKGGAGELGNWAREGLGEGGIGRGTDEDDGDDDQILIIFRHEMRVPLQHIQSP